MTEKRPRSDRFDRGLEMRRTVLGDEYVDKSLAAADDFNWPMQPAAKASIIIKNAVFVV